jgi:hypothetical protein
MPAIGAILSFILANPAIVQAGEQVLVGAIQAAIDAWNRWHSGDLTADQLQAEWAAMGIDVKAANDAWEAAGNAP